MLIYTFRTNPFKNKLLEKFPNLFIFGKLKEDFNKLSESIINNNPDYILGIASSNNSRFEPVAINKFKKTKKISIQGQKQYDLFIPQSNIKKSFSPTDSFCNWTMYKIAEFIEKNKLSTKLIFAHLEQNDLPNLIRTLNFK